MPDVETVTLFKPVSSLAAPGQLAATPVPSMLSAVDGLALQPGQFRTLRNLRTDSGALEARAPTVQVSAAPFVGALPRGMWAGRLGGADWMLGAWSDGAATRVYASADGGATWTEATAAAGAYGNTRFETPGPFVTFALVNSYDLGDCVVAQNGADLPRVYSRTARNGQTVAVAAPVDYPAAASNLSAGGVPSGFLPMNRTTGPTISAATGHFAAGGAFLSDGGLAVTPGTIAAGDSVTLHWATPVDFSSATQLCLVGISQGAIPSAWLLGFRIELGQGSAWTTLYDPSAATPPSTSGELLADKDESGGPIANWMLDTIDLRGLAAAARLSVDGLRLTKAGASETNPTLFDRTFAGAFGGAAKGTGASYGSDADSLEKASYLVSLFCSGSGTESAGVVVSGLGSGRASLGALGMNPTAIGGRTLLPPFEKTVLPPGVPIVPPSPAQLAMGVDRVKVYRQDYGSTDYLLASTVAVGAYGGGAWSSSPGRGAVSYLADTVAQLNLEATRFAPDAYSIPVPIGTAGIGANGRLHVGGDGEFWASEQNEPLRFGARPFAVLNGQPVSRSAVHGKIPGDLVQGYSAVAGSVLGGSSVVMLTSRYVYVVSGFDAYALALPTPLAEVGCVAPRSIAAYKTAIYFLDDRLEIRRVEMSEGSVQAFAPLTKRRVDDRTLGAVSPSLAVGTAYGDGYALWHRQAARATQDRALVWDEAVAGFIEDEVAFGVVAADVSSGRTILQAADGSVWEHARAGADGTVAVTIETAHLHRGPWGRIFVGAVGVLADAQAAGTLMAVSRVGRMGRTVASTLDLGPYAAEDPDTGAPVAGALAWCWDERADGGVPGHSDVAIGLTLSATLRSGSRVLGIVADVQDAGEGAQ